MKSPLYNHFRLFITLILSFFILGGQPVEFGKDKIFFHGYLIKEPIIKIGLGVNLSDIKISSSSGMKVYEVNSHYQLLAEDADDVRIKGQREKLSEKFLVQVAQARKREEAEKIAQDLALIIEKKIYVIEDQENKIARAFQVKVGDFLTRGEALSFIKELNRVGIKESWILREEVTTDNSKPHWILINDELMSLHETTVLYFIPKNIQSFLSFNGRDYRGLLVLKASPKGLVLVNILNIEDYLKGVVPSELSPYDFSEFEAHKAQAVAARTYAIKKLGMHSDLGFDLSDTPKTQFYAGMNAEHPLSTQAVEMTQGEVVLYKGKLINALYTSTCGGMTEDVENIFGGPSLPYLRSTECTYERQKEYIIESQQSILPILAENINISALIVSLISSNIIPPETDPAFYTEEASFEDALSWTKNALDVVGKQTDGFSSQSSTLNYANFVRLIVQAFDWQERIQNLMIESERKFISKDYPNWNGDEKDYLAYFVQSGIFFSSKNVENPEAALTRGELAFYLGKIVQSYRDLAHSGVFRGLEEDEIELEKDTETIKLRMSPDIILLVNNNGEYAFDSRLALLGGEKVRWIEEEEEVQMLEVVYPPYSNILDRGSRLHIWQARKSKQELEERVNQFYPIGKLLGLVPQKRGESKRVVELLIKGSETQALVKGFKIRRVLGLRDTLFVIDRESDETDNISHFTFRGKGWGHGVGLCQVGAVGMARAGADYKSILKKYYQGIKISKIY